MKINTIFAPAKINLFLHVTGRRDNGYHELQSLFVPLDWGDTLTFTERKDNHLNRTTDIPGIPAHEDLVIRAAVLLRQYVHSTFGVSYLTGFDISLDKVLPTGAGLGGGSSDAAYTLHYLNQQWQLGLSINELERLGLQLGADVPFFVRSQPALVTGIGEYLLPIDIPHWHYLVLCPEQAVPTIQIFKDPYLIRNQRTLDFQEIIAALSTAPKEPARKENRLGQWIQPDIPGCNNLEEVACRLYPVLEQTRQWVRSLGIKVRMSGSGSSFFAAFYTKEEANHALNTIKDALRSQEKPSAVVFRALKVCTVFNFHRECFTKSI